MGRDITTLGIIGGSGMLGQAISSAVLTSGAVAPSGFWIANRSGRADGLVAWPGITITADSQALVDACDIVVLSVPPAQARAMRIDARGKLVISVMAGVTMATLRTMTGAERVVRAMSSPAAAHRLAYSPWYASAAVTQADRRAVQALFTACGQTDAVGDEVQLDLFTAMTGPVPGFVAFFADSMVRYAEARGVAPEIADRAVRQLFLAAGTMMAAGSATPADHVQQMVDYAGTTAAGLQTMRASAIAEEIAAGLDAAVAKARGIG
ncbi:MAG: NAD(P)-binding domain-containing protein [Rhodobacteraceae bacterium]|nr:NAD(P)-binding domain-containing protein [Paracoccaceae bacterium]